MPERPCQPRQDLHEEAAFLALADALSPLIARSTRRVPIGARVVAATNRDLKASAWPWSSSRSRRCASAARTSYPPELEAATREFERAHILRVIEQCDGNKRKAAKVLGIGATSLYRKLGTQPPGESNEPGTDIRN
jgi:DNA-binding NtrC family response regulator